MISQDNILKVVVDSDPDNAKIQFCDEHYDRLVKKLTVHGIDHLITNSVEALKARIASKKIDPLFHAQHALMMLATNTIGTEGVVQFKCPVCSFEKFDFIGHTALEMKRVCVRKPS